MSSSRERAVDCTKENEPAELRTSMDASVDDNLEVSLAELLRILRWKRELCTDVVLASLVGVLQDPVKWTGEAPGEMDDALSIVQFLAVLLDVMALSFDQQEQKRSMQYLHLLFTQWKVEGELSLTRTAIDWFEKRTGKTTPWPIRAVVMRRLRWWIWVEIPLPSCLVECLELGQFGYRGEDCQHSVHMTMHDDSVFQCALESLFQLGQFSMPMVREILTLGKFERMVRKTRMWGISEPVTNATVDELKRARTVQEWRNCKDTLVLFLGRFGTTKRALEGCQELHSLTLGLAVIAPAIKLVEVLDRVLTPGASSSVTLTYVQNFCVVLRELVIERVVTLDNPLAKYYAFTLLHSSCTRLMENKESEQTEVRSLLRAVVAGAEKGELEWQTTIKPSG